MPNKDPEKRKEYAKLHYQKNKDRYIENATNWAKKNKESRIEIRKRFIKSRLNSGLCVDCGNQNDSKGTYRCVNCSLNETIAQTERRQRKRILS